MKSNKISLLVIVLLFCSCQDNFSVKVDKEQIPIINNLSEKYKLIIGQNKDSIFGKDLQILCRIKQRSAAIAFLGSTDNYPIIINTGKSYYYVIPSKNLGDVNWISDDDIFVEQKIKLVPLYLTSDFDSLTLDQIKEKYLIKVAEKEYILKVHKNLFSEDNKDYYSMIDQIIALAETKFNFFIKSGDYQEMTLYEQ